jgi:hypothetical protein
VPHPSPSQSEDRILPFRPRGSLLARNAPRPTPVIPDLKRFEHADDEPDDFRHRMLMNGLGLIVVVFLIACGLWIADVMAQMRKNQDCVLSGRAGCTPVQAPLQSR